MTTAIRKPDSAQTSATSKPDEHRAPQWLPGRSANPGGRPKKLRVLEDMAREHTVGAMRAIVAALDDDDVRVRLEAAGMILDRGWGKARQVVSGDPENPIRIEALLANVSGEELAALLAKQREELAALVAERAALPEGEVEGGER